MRILSTVDYLSGHIPGLSFGNRSPFIVNNYFVEDIRSEIRSLRGIQYDGLLMTLDSSVYHNNRDGMSIFRFLVTRVRMVTSRTPVRVVDVVKRTVTVSHSIFPNS